MAVEIFYVISGFLMGLILNEKYGPAQNWLFYSNRILRIYVPYLVVWLAAFAAAILIPLAFGKSPTLPMALSKTPTYATALFTSWDKLDLTAAAYVGITNLAIIGQDIGMWLGFNGSLYWTQHFLTAPIQVWTLQLLPQAWTLSLELTFYVLVPFIARKNIALLIALLALSAFARTAAYSFGLNFDPWSYRFFPFELALFLAGLISYRLFAATRAWPIWNRRVAIVVMICVIYTVVNYYDFAKNTELSWQWPYYGLVALAIPFLFFVTNQNRLDNWIGDLSYPIYLIHWPVLGIVNMFFSSNYITLATVSITVLVSIVFVQLIDHSLNRLRQSRYRQSKAEIATASTPAARSQNEQHDAAYKTFQGTTMPAES